MVTAGVIPIVIYAAEWKFIHLEKVLSPSEVWNMISERLIFEWRRFYLDDAQKTKDYFGNLNLQKPELIYFLHC